MKIAISASIAYLNWAQEHKSVIHFIQPDPSVQPTREIARDDGRDLDTIKKDETTGEYLLWEDGKWKPILPLHRLCLQFAKEFKHANTSLKNFMIYFGGKYSGTCKVDMKNMITQIKELEKKLDRKFADEEWDGEDDGQTG